MKNYSEMTDFQINKAVGDASGVEWAKLDSNYHALSIWDDGELCVFAPCNSWADAGPIIAKYNISLIANGGDDWLAAGPGAGIDGYLDSKSGVGTYGEDLFSHGLNPLRAAMIVFLMMQESK